MHAQYAHIQKCNILSQVQCIQSCLKTKMPMHTLNINIKSCTETGISITIWVPHDVVGIPDVVIDVERKASDWTRQWLQWGWKDMRRIVSNKWACHWNIRWTQPRHMCCAAMRLLLTCIKDNTIIVNHCKKTNSTKSTPTLCFRKQHP